jgi:hypothetical protein
MLGANIPVRMTTTFGKRPSANFSALIKFDKVLDRMLPAKRFGSKRRQQPSAFLHCELFALNHPSDRSWRQRRRAARSSNINAKHRRSTTTRPQGCSAQGTAPMVPASDQQLKSRA